MRKSRLEQYRTFFEAFSLRSSTLSTVMLDRPTTGTGRRRKLPRCGFRLRIKQAIDFAQFLQELTKDALEIRRSSTAVRGSEAYFSEPILIELRDDLLTCFDKLFSQRGVQSQRGSKPQTLRPTPPSARFGKRYGWLCASIRLTMFGGLRLGRLFRVDPIGLRYQLGCHVFEDCPVALMTSAFRNVQTIAGTVSEALC